MQYTSISSTNASKSVTFLKQYIWQFAPVEIEELALDTVYAMPYNAALITSRWFASSNEGLILVAKKSRKVKQYGKWYRMATGTHIGSRIKYLVFFNY